MSRFARTGLIARREYAHHFRRPMYLFTAFGIPLMLLGVMLFVFSLSADEEGQLDKFQRIGYVDQAGVLAALPDAPERFVAMSDVATARAALEGDDLDAYMIIPPDYLDSGVVQIYSYDSPGFAIESAINGLLRDGLAATAQTPYPPERLADPLDVTFRTLDGEQIGNSPEDFLPRLLMPIIFVMLLFLGTNTTSQFLMGSVVQEKENRLVEVLVTSCTPEALMAGKLLGLGGLALTQLVAWGSVSWVVTLLNNDAGQFLQNSGITPQLAVLFLGLFVLQYGLIASIMLAVGASVAAEQEGQQIAGFLTLLSMAPIFVIGLFIEQSSSAIIPALNLFPLSAATTLLLRMTIGGGAGPGWIAATVAVLVVSIGGMVWLAARVFRLGMLLYGQRLSGRAIWRALRRTPSGPADN